MNNADRPAMPLLERLNEHGLTKREHFAAMAPSEIPKWFFMIWIKTKEATNDAYQWSREGDPRFGTINEAGLTDEGEAAMYFAWKAYHADALLKALEGES